MVRIACQFIVTANQDIHQGHKPAFWFSVLRSVPWWGQRPGLGGLSLSRPHQSLPPIRPSHTNQNGA